MSSLNCCCCWCLLLLPLQGKWSATEDAQLLALYKELGPKWKEIGSRLGRLDKTTRNRVEGLNYGKPFNTGGIRSCLGYGICTTLQLC